MLFKKRKAKKLMCELRDELEKLDNLLDEKIQEQKIKIKSDMSEKPEWMIKEIENPLDNFQHVFAMALKEPQHVHVCGIEYLIVKL